MGGFIDFAAHKLPLSPGATYQKRCERSQRMLLRALNLKTTVAFIGSGCSQAFDYPSWDEFVLNALRHTVDVLERERPQASGLRYVRALQKGVEERTEKLNPGALMFLIGACKKALRQNQLQHAYAEYVHEQFGRAHTAPEVNPYKVLAKLPIYRFVTTNYDCEIERALIGDEPSPRPEDYGLGGPDLLSLGKDEARKSRFSFTQKTADLGRLVRFALAGAAAGERAVFHCHGRFDDPDSVVATEADYQDWYLGTSQEGASFAFRQTLRLLLGSNPLLFIGYSLRDEDLLHPLRQLGVLDPDKKEARPVFALLSRTSLDESGSDYYIHESHFERFGLHVIPYKDDPTGDAKERTRALCAKLEEIGAGWRTASADWLRKPMLRRTAALARPPGPHCEINGAADVPVSRLDWLDPELRRPGVLAVTGPAGSGKSLHLLRLVQSLSRLEARSGLGFQGTFYWNAHYATEANTAIDAALSYLDPDGRFAGARYARIRQVLCSERHLIVLDACERLLRRSHGGSYSLSFRCLLRAFADPESRSLVVIAGRRCPVELRELHESLGPRSLIRFEKLERVEAQDLDNETLFAELPPGSRPALSALCSLLRGHNYGLLLAGAYLRREDDPAHGLEELNRRLSDRRSDERLREILQLVLRRIDGGRRSGLAATFLERMALFLGPVSRAALEICFEDAKAVSGPSDRSLEALLDELRRHSLVFQMETPSGKADTVHATVRAPLFQNRHGLPDDPLPSFGISGFLSGRVGVDPDRERRKQLQQVFEKIVTAADQALDAKETGKARDLCRDAFTLLRTRMSATTAPRWCTYEEYVRFGIQIAILARQVAPGSWDYCEFPDAARFAQHAEGPLYPAELAWLYNDIALALSSEGLVIDAYSIWEQTHEICRLIEDPVTGGGFHLEVLLSLALNLIEMGRISLARRYLEDAERLLESQPEDDYMARILGMRAWMAHLGGNLQGAEKMYEECLRLLEDGSNLRAQSFFNKHLARVKIETGALDEADLVIRNSLALAEAGMFPELVCSARMAEGYLHMRRKELVPARLTYNRVLREAQQMGFRKLEVSALTALARIALCSGDAEGARDLALRSLSLANELGLGLRRTHSLVVLGLATLETGQKELGVAHLRLAKRMADEQEYWSRGREAENKLLALGESPERAS